MCSDMGEEAAMTAEKSEARKRESAWLSGEDPSAWRPKKRYRFGMARWCVDTDNALAQSTSIPGLHYFKVPE